MGLNAVLGGLSGVAGVLSGFGASRRAKALQEARDRLLAEIGSDLERRYQSVQENNLQALRRNTGLLGDSLRQQGSDLGAGLAAAGVTNSSVTGGVMANQAAANGATLGRQASQNLATEEGLLSSNKSHLNDLRLGYINQDLGEAKANAAGAWNGVANLATGLGSILAPASKGPVVTPGAPAASGSPVTAGTTSNPLGLNLSLGGDYPVDRGQSFVQQMAAKIGAGVGSPNVNSVAQPLMNGTMNKGLGPTSGPITLTQSNGYRRLY